jgi:hypothetical protein
MTSECANQLAVLVSSKLDSKFLRYRLAETELAAGFNEQLSSCALHYAAK